MMGLATIILAQRPPQPQPQLDGIGVILGLVCLILIVVAIVIASMWVVFTKAREPGWAAIIPIYNMVVLLRIAGKPEWWVILMLIPFVNLVIGILVAIALAEKFGQGGGFAVGLILLPFVFYPLLAFGSAEYQGGRGRSRDDDYDDDPRPRRRREDDDDYDDPRPRRR